MGLDGPNNIVPALHALKPLATFNHLPVNVIVQRILVLLDEIILAPEIGSVSDGERHKYWRRGSRLIARFSRDTLSPVANSN